MNKIKWITQVFAQDSEVQKSLFPNFVNVADELAVEWEIALDEVNENAELTEEQRLVIKVLDDYMLSISGPANIQYWNNDALCHSSEWCNMRKMAKNILDIMKWDCIVPPKSDAIYINKG
ncbi:hypothetical protein F6Q07_22855 [Pectobacterium parmentieri]|uniref:Uncharacterized protein n=1 Tax=Pectobacterium parmentieri TaxID=1905730 RepID=A0A0H3HZH5_PECPM|nr:hypothetical protein [Pectobacterium parmentieri]ACX86276.1 hypothetical protein Pecwa_0434 [Pectobacterium parmentieri WPP163]AFI88573.1 Hypothetical protein W5S_0446 [Pectobacterium parmentieri]AYG99879.1 hypothetical protein C5E26_02305 [Pectobacterium parmentieri]AYH04339.1 hypothetical protein C5E25_02555 [Pectobacterium parmentieri]AYH13161.1 hypothetical protein C5E23_02540 [Pectobacterium parmentieri]